MHTLPSNFLTLYMLQLLAETAPRDQKLWPEIPYCLEIPDFPYLNVLILVLRIYALLTSLSSSFESILTADCLFWEIHSALCTRPSFSTGSPSSRSLRSISRYSREQSGCSRGRSGTILMFMKNPRTVNGWHAGYGSEYGYGYGYRRV